MMTILEIHNAIAKNMCHCGNEGKKGCICNAYEYAQLYIEQLERRFEEKTIQKLKDRFNHQGAVEEFLDPHN